MLQNLRPSSLLQKLRRPRLRKLRPRSLLRPRLRKTLLRFVPRAKLRRNTITVAGLSPDACKQD